MSYYQSQPPPPHLQQNSSRSGYRYHPNTTTALSGGNGGGVNNMSYASNSSAGTTHSHPPQAGDYPPASAAYSNQRQHYSSQVAAVPLSSTQERHLQQQQQQQQQQQLHQQELQRQRDIAAVNAYYAQQKEYTVLNSKYPNSAPPPVAHHHQQQIYENDGGYYHQNPYPPNNNNNGMGEPHSYSNGYNQQAPPPLTHAHTVGAQPLQQPQMQQHAPNYDPYQSPALAPHNHQQQRPRQPPPPSAMPPPVSYDSSGYYAPQPPPNNSNGYSYQQQPVVSQGYNVPPPPHPYPITAAAAVPPPMAASATIAAMHSPPHRHSSLYGSTPERTNSLSRRKDPAPQQRQPTQQRYSGHYDSLAASMGGMTLGTNNQALASPAATAAILHHQSAHTPPPVVTTSACNLTPYPVWYNIGANSFHAYKHKVSVKKCNLSGIKYALVIGINYYGLEYSQTSNINSAHTFRNLLIAKYGYLERNVVLLSDALPDKKSQPTHQLITHHIKRMMSKVKSNDSVFFYFCGFGGRLPSQVLDVKSEVTAGIRNLRADFILPRDFEMTGAIDSRYLYKYLVRQLPSSARLTAVFDCVISDTGLGVPYKYTTVSDMKPVLTNVIAGGNLFEAGMDLAQKHSGNSSGELSQRLENTIRQQRREHSSDEELNRLEKSCGDIIVFGWDRNYSNPDYKKYLLHTPSNQLGAFWSAAMENGLNSKQKNTFGDILTYLKDRSSDLVMMPFVATGRKISMDEDFVI